MLARRTPMKRSSFKKREKPTLADLKGSGLVTTAKNMVPKPRKKLKARSPRNKGGQVALFERIWKSRPHKCEVCGDSIREATASNFSHILSKNAYPSMKMDERNVELWCEGCHRAWTDKTFKMRDGWIRVFEKFCSLRDEANGLTQKP